MPNGYLYNNFEPKKGERGNELGLKYEYSILVSIWKVVLQKSNVDIYCN